MALLAGSRQPTNSIEVLNGTQRDDPNQAVITTGPFFPDPATPEGRGCQTPFTPALQCQYLIQHNTQIKTFTRDNFIPLFPLSTSSAHMIHLVVDRRTGQPLGRCPACDVAVHQAPRLSSASDQTVRHKYTRNSTIQVLLSYLQASVLWHCWLGGRKGIWPVKKWGGWWRWALLSPDGVAPSWMVGVSASVNLPLHHEVHKFSSGTGSPGWSWKNGRKTVVVVVVSTGFSGLGTCISVSRWVLQEETGAYKWIHRRS